MRIIKFKQITLILSNYLNKNCVNSVIKSDIVVASKICLNQFYFQFKNATYIKDDGLIMSDQFLTSTCSRYFHGIHCKNIQTHPFETCISFIGR